MKKIGIVLSILFMMILTNTNVYATNQTEEPILTIIAKADKEEYQIGDSIYYKITVTNNTEYIGENLSVIVELPETVTIEQPNTLVFSKDTILPGQSYVFDIYGQVVDASNSVDITVNGTTQTSNLSATPIVETGDFINSNSYILIFGLSALIIVLGLKKRKKLIRYTKIFIIISLPIALLQTIATEVKAQEGVYHNQNQETTFPIFANGQEAQIKVSATVDFNQKGDGKITLDQELDEYGVLEIDNSMCSLSGTASDPDGIQLIKIEIDDYSGNIKTINAQGTNQWTGKFEGTIGTSLIKIIGIDYLGNESYFTFKINCLSDSIIVTDNTVIIDDNDSSELADAFVDFISTDMGNDDVNDDGDYLILDKSNSFTKKIMESSYPNIGDILMIPPCDAFPTGFTTKLVKQATVVDLNLAPEYVYPNGIVAYDDESYLVIFTQAPALSELIKSDLSLHDDENIELNYDNILFAVGADGSDLLNPKNEITTFADNGAAKAKSKIDLLPKLSFKTDNDKSNLFLGWQNQVLFDADGDLDNTTNDQLVLNGGVGIKDIEINSFIEYKPSLSEWLPRQMQFKGNATEYASISATFGGEMNMESFVEWANGKLNNGFDNKYSTKIFGQTIDIAGIELNKEIYLASIGIPISAHPIIVTGGLNSVASVSISPTVVLSVVLDLEGNIKTELELGYAYEKTDSFMANFQKNGYVGSHGSVEDNRGDQHFEIGDNSFDIQFNKGEPTSTFTLELEGSATVNFGVGVNSGLMLLGIIPLSVGADVELNAETTLKGKLELVDGQLHKDNFMGEIKLGAACYAKVSYRFKTPLTNFKNNQKWKLVDIFGPVHEQFNTDMEVAGAIYKNEDTLYDGTGGFVKLTSRNGNEYLSEIVNGKYRFEDIMPGDYSLYLNLTGYNIVNENIKLPINLNNSTFKKDIYLVKEPSVFGVGNYELAAIIGSPSSTSILACEDSIVSYYREGQDGNDAEYNLSVKKGDTIFIASLLEITVHSGSFKLIFSEGYGLSDSCTFNTMAEPAIYGIDLQAGESVSLDNQAYNGDINYHDIRIWGAISSDAIVKEINTDYWWNKYIGWEITITEYDLRPGMTFWAPLKSCIIKEYRVEQGTAKIYLRYKDKDELKITR